SDLNNVWRALASPDAQSSYRAMCSLLADRRRLLVFLREQFAEQRLDCDPGAIRRWVAQLDAERFEDREAASAELRRWSFLMPDELRNMLVSARSPESKARLKSIVSGWDEPSNQPEWLRWLRYLELLETDGSQEALQLLRKIIEHCPKSLLAQAAKD